MVQVISVEAVPGGWSVVHPMGVEPQLFLSGAKAEMRARELGARLSRSGQPAEVRVHARDGVLVGKLEYPADHGGF